MMTKEREDVRLMKSTAEDLGRCTGDYQAADKGSYVKQRFRQAVLQSIENDQATIALANEFGRNVHQ